MDSYPPRTITQLEQHPIEVKECAEYPTSPTLPFPLVHDSYRLGDLGLCHPSCADVSTSLRFSNLVILQQHGPQELNIRSQVHLYIVLMLSEES